MDDSGTGGRAGIISANEEGDYFEIREFTNRPKKVIVISDEKIHRTEHKLPVISRSFGKRIIISR
jgi:hypothetical protein